MYWAQPRFALYQRVVLLVGDMLAPLRLGSFVAGTASVTDMWVMKW